MHLALSLRKLESEMENFASPDNKNGFYRQFCFWVYKTWSECEFVDTEVVDVGYDCSTYPVKTGLLAAEKCSTYKDFINSNTGNGICTYNSGSGMACEQYSEKLQELFGDACSQKLSELIMQHGLVVPDKYKSDCEDISELIFSQCADYQEDPELYGICDSIMSRFGAIGYEVEPYTCNVCGVDPDGNFIYEDSQFADMTLDDFKRLMVV